MNRQKNEQKLNRRQSIQTIFLESIERHEGSSHCGSMVTKPTSNHEDAGLIPGLTQWVEYIALP